MGLDVARIVGHCFGSSNGLGLGEQPVGLTCFCIFNSTTTARTTMLAVASGTRRKVMQAAQAAKSRIYHYYYIHTLMLQPTSLCVFSKAKNTKLFSQTVQAFEVGLSSQKIDKNPKTNGSGSARGTALFLSSAACMNQCFRAGVIGSHQHAATPRKDRVSWTEMRLHSSLAAVDVCQEDLRNIAGVLSVHSNFPSALAQESSIGAKLAGSVIASGSRACGRLPTFFYLSLWYRAWSMIASMLCFYPTMENLLVHTGHIISLSDGPVWRRLANSTCPSA